MIDLAENYGKGLVKTEEIARRRNIPKKYLEQILLVLKRAGYLHSRRGANGGYKLSRHPKQITVAEILRLTDGPLAPVESVSKYFYEPTPVTRNKRLLKVFKEIRDYVANKLENTSFWDIVGSQ